MAQHFLFLLKTGVWLLAPTRGSSKLPVTPASPMLSSGLLGHLDLWFKFITYLYINKTDEFFKNRSQTVLSFLYYLDISFLIVQRKSQFVV